MVRSCHLRGVTLPPPQSQYPLKWAFIELLPMFGIFALFVVYVIVYTYKTLFLAIPAFKRHNHLPQLISCIIVMFRVLYIYLTRTALDVFNCVPTSPPDGNTYMAGLLQYPCGGSVQIMLLTPALVAFILYSVVSARCSRYGSCGPSATSSSALGD